MKNPQIITKLNSMMMREQQEKHEAITCILGGYRELGLINSINQEFDLICDLQSMFLGDLSQILGDLVSDLESKLHIRELKRK